MKNIHILPTDKPSRLFENTDGGLSIDDELQPNGIMCQNQNIYITSDEEIKEGDWIFNPYTEYPYKADYKLVENSKQTKGFHIKKIILTTDQDLIKDSVQVIDDEFLEWFVKNPSCEEVEIEDVYKTFLERNKRSVSNFRNRYKIIIPKEESKFENSIENSINVMSIANSMFGKKEEPKQDLIKYPLTPDECFKQETLEEAGLKHCDILDKFPALVNPLFTFKEGAKWQQERSYSEEEVEILLETLSKVLVYQGNEYILPFYFQNEIKQVIEQFKKK